MCPPKEALAWAKVSTSHSDVFPASINVSSHTTHLNAPDELINGLIIRAAQIVVEFDRVDAGGGGGDKSVKKSSKSRQKVEELSKSPKASRV